MGRQGVAGQVGSIDEGDVEALAGEQHRGRRAGASGADDDDVVRVVGVVPLHGATIRHRALSTLGEVVESGWRSRESHRNALVKGRSGRSTGRDSRISVTRPGRDGAVRSAQPP